MQHAGICVLLTLAVLVVFWPVTGHGFTNYDDDTYVTANKVVLQGLTYEGIRWALTSFYAANWHPLTWVSHMIDIEIHGQDPGGHHLNNLLLHVLNTLLLFTFLARTTGATMRSGLVALLFGIHPLHVESVAWIAERKDLLSTCFWFLTLLAYVSYSRKPGTIRYGLVFLILAMGLASKPMLVTVPFVLLVLDYWPLERYNAKPWKSLALEKIPLLALSAASSLVTLLAQHSGGSIGSLERYGFIDRGANAIVSYATYVWKSLVPTGLAVIYPHPLSSVPALPFMAAALLLSTATIGAVMLRRKAPYIPAGWLWFAGTLVPVIGLVQVGEQAMADRYTYVPLVGLFILTVWGVYDIALKALGRKATTIAFTMIVVATTLTLGSLSRHQVRYWSDSITLFERALQVTDDNYNAHLNLALALGEAGRHQDAVDHLESALEIRPDLAKINFNLGINLVRLERNVEAAFHFRRALESRPRDATIHYNLGTALALTEDLNGAVAAFRRAIEIDPEYAMAHYNLGVALHVLGDHSAAREEIALAERYGYVPANPPF